MMIETMSGTSQIANPPPEAYRLPDAEGREYLPAAYHAIDPAARGPIAPLLPRNVFIEVTNHCNLLCETCPRTFVTYEEPKTLAWEDFLRIVVSVGFASRSINWTTTLGIRDDVHKRREAVGGVHFHLHHLPFQANDGAGIHFGEHEVKCI
jgi:hypothetical protein